LQNGTANSNLLIFYLKANNMKTKLLLIVIFLLSYIQNTFSQEYFPLLNESSWIINDAVSCCVPPQVKNIDAGSDIEIAGVIYKKFGDPFPVYDTATSSYIDSIYVREDVIARKVYKFVDGADVLLYDFSLAEGDTVFQYDYHWTATVDNVSVIGGTRKRITLHSVELWNDHILTQIWIEGVGSNAHPFYPARNMYSVGASGGGYNIFTKCSFQNGFHVYGDPVCESLAHLTIAENSYPNQEIVLSPNPFISALTINAAVDLQDATLKLFNLQGQLVREVSNLNGKKATINRENLNHGLYFVQLFENGKRINSTKVMVD
jgi:hypothetical protein